ncbi:hypothetical protein, partial [Streptomyces olivaceus]|uniref:hypothetical protein n=1 Tax=Streptomyces olivaceus TaxID=47716 RepID=UPI0040560539
PLRSTPAPTGGWSQRIEPPPIPERFTLPGTEGYPRVQDYPAFLAEMTLTPGMSFAFEPNYAYNRHLAHLGGTVLVGEDGPIELNPYSAQLLPAAGGPLLAASTDSPLTAR